MSLDDRLATHDDFKLVQAETPDYWSDRRWDYMSVVIEMLRKSVGVDAVLEIGAAGFPLVQGSTVMDVWFRPDVEHNAAETPWPFQDRTFDMVVGLQVWEHLTYHGKGAQELAFKELMRVGRRAILSFPYLWETKDKDNCHYMIDKDRINEWTCGVPPCEVVEIGAGSRCPRLIYRWEFS